MTKLIRTQNISKLCHLRGLSSSSSPGVTVEDIDFSDHKTVFKYKSTVDLLRNLSILRICSINKFVDNALPIMRWSEKYLGQTLFSTLARQTFYRQFVGGDTETELASTEQQLTRSVLRLMVCPAMEEDAGEGGEGEEKYDFNAEYIENIGAMMVNMEATRPCLQFKITAMAPADLVTKISGLLSDGSIDMRSTVDTISGGLRDGTQLSLPELTSEENAQLQLAVARMRRFGLAGRERRLHLLVDAEYTYMNRGISAFALALMVAFNTERPVVWNTYQCYLKAALSTISSEMEVVQSFGKRFGAKLVRGAYMDKERKLAQMKGYEDPVNDTYEETGKMYNRVVDFMMDKMAENLSENQINMVVATHNEAGALHAANKMLSSGIPPDSGHVVFGQIYGMAEQISIPLAAAGFTVYKSVPYGPLTEVLPYLSRRAQENRVVLAGARREQELLIKEIRRRLLRI